MKVFYLHHSGFLVDLENYIFIFDDITDIPDNLLGAKKPTFFLVSHAHGDHYSSNIWNYKNSNTVYILSSDIRRAQDSEVIKMNPGEQLQFDNVKITTFGSTDQGVSYLVETPNETIFFSGDLNWWAWDPKTRPHIDPKAEEDDYKTEISKLKSYLNGKKIDLAFVPVDPRLDLKDGEVKAALYFIDELHPEKLVPMHFWGDHKAIDRLIDKLPTNCSTQIGKFDEDNSIVNF